MAKYDGTLDSDDLSIYNVKKTMKEVTNYFCKYRMLKEKTKIISSTLKSSLSDDNMGIFSSGISDPTSAKAEQLVRIGKFVDEVETVIKLNERKLSVDERIVLKSDLIKKHSEEDLIEEMNVGRTKFYEIKKSCYIKVAIWFDIETYKEGII